jgi:outer membrane protein TolC
LDSALAMAAKQNPGVQLARLRVLERQAESQSIQSGYLPQADLVVSGTYQTTNLQGIGLIFPGFPSRIGPYRTFNARPVVTQRVLDMPLLADIRASRLEASAARLDVESVREEAQAAVITLYLQTFQAQSRVKAAQARFRTAEALLAQVTDRQKAGASSQLDLSRNLQQQEAERLALVAAEQEAALLRPALAEWLGGPVEGELAEPSFRVQPSELKGERPDLRAAEQRIKAAEQEVIRARRERWPKLGASGDYGVLGAGPDQSTSTYAAGATLQIPLWTSGRIAAGIQAAEQRLAQRKEEKRRLELAVERQAAQALVTYQAQMRAATAARESAAAARKVLELARLRYESGLATSVDTVTAQGALAEAEESEIRARYESSIALARLAFARGDVQAVVR